MLKEHFKENTLRLYYSITFGITLIYPAKQRTDSRNIYFSYSKY